MRINKTFFLLFFIALLPTLLLAQNQDAFNQRVDKLVDEVLKTFNVPGIAVGIIKDDKVVLAKGYGVESIASENP